MNFLCIYLGEGKGGALMHVYSETLKTPIRKFGIFKIYKAYSKLNEFLFILYYKIDPIMS